MATKDTNIYLVDTPVGKKLVEAKNKASALNFVVHKTHLVKLATQKEIVESMKAGVEIESAAQLDLPTITG